MAATRKLLVIINALFFICGAGIAAMGGLALSDTDMGLSLVDKNLGMALVVLGGLVALVALLGMCGVALKSNMVLRLYFCLMFIIVLAEIFVVVFSITQRAQMEHLLSKGWRNAGQGMRNDFQRREHCCGFETPTSPSNTVCEACPDLGKCRLPGCKEALEHEVKKNLLIIEIVGSVVGLLQLMGLIFACCAIQAKKREQRARWEHGRPLLGPTSERSINATDSAFPRPVVSSATVGAKTHNFEPVALYDDSLRGESSRPTPAATTWKPKSTAEMIQEIRAEKEAERQRALKDGTPDF
ncbi:tetraspanin family protein [Thecamonas trahens ATCC 50062]|uniref:Tetraspanin family protein n=1 Tax=Thecamonas trahens ATCC 50062 TaxID=461836 RepID=A0A0L0DWC5_THETB|nr:tetraspanin family protein [Thecamonas trahens ATCC 50062]KNC56386.1 tetraspanin family protein [Thecamonas trahens ATCC 50062]|eukprot:XP_013760900.1 tetraspanin family protein [Thecamonas trahens ATCC 50062]